MIRFFIAVLLVFGAAAQAVKPFDVVSIKPDRDGHGLNAGTQPDGRYTARNVSALFLMTQAFGIKTYQISSAPKWLDDDHYDISAKADSANQLSQDQLKPLLQAMLVDRFRLRFHKERREFPVYSLIVGKSGPKFSADNNILVSESLNVSSNHGRATMTGRKMTMQGLAKQLGDVAGRTVVGYTGLTDALRFQSGLGDSGGAGRYFAICLRGCSGATRAEAGFGKKRSGGGRRHREHGKGLGELMTKFIVDLRSRS